MKVGGDRMKLPNEYVDELKLLENKRIKKVVDAAREEFIEQGIMNAKMKNIALRAGVGEASVYRYFSDKNELAKIVAFSYWNEMFLFFQEHMRLIYQNAQSSLEKIRGFLNIYKILYQDYPNFLIFTEDFDGYMQYVINDTKTAQFGSMISGIKEFFLSMIKEGIQNHEIKETLDLNYIYSYVSQVMAATTQKLVRRIGYLHEELDNYGERCIEDLIEMFILYIKK